MATSKTEASKIGEPPTYNYNKVYRDFKAYTANLEPRDFVRIHQDDLKELLDKIEMYDREQSKQRFLPGD